MAKEEKFLSLFPNIKDSAFYTLKPGTMVNYCGVRMVDCNDIINGTIYTTKLEEFCEPLIYSGIGYDYKYYSLQEWVNVYDIVNVPRIELYKNNPFGKSIYLLFPAANGMRDVEFFFAKIDQNKWDRHTAVPCYLEIIR